MPPLLTIRDIWLSERRVEFQHPFRFGDVTVTRTSQAFIHVEIDIDGKRATGASAELMVPKWFDKNPALSIEQTVDELRTSLAIARGLYLAKREPDTAFGIHASIYAKHVEACAKAGLPALAALFGPAEIDKAIVDALLRAFGLDVFAGLQQNIVGLDLRLTPDISQSVIDRFLTSRSPERSINVRHTVGMTDPVESLSEPARNDGCRYFKIKLCGDPERDIARLEDLAKALDSFSIDYRATLDANEQYDDPLRLRRFVQQFSQANSLADFARRVLYIEQPMPRDLTRQTPIGDVAKSFAFIVDEADDDYQAFPRAVALGYRGISSKSCKGLYKSLLNASRSMAWNETGLETFMTAEDLTCQAGLGVQQDTVLAAFLGCSHVERNGHHYVDGFADTPADEAALFLAAHPDLYENKGGKVSLRIENGVLSFGSLLGAGFASGVAPQDVGLSSTTPIQTKEYAT